MTRFEITSVLGRTGVLPGSGRQGVLFIREATGARLAIPLPPCFRPSEAACACGILRAMSGRDLELVAQTRRALDAYNRGDFDGIMKNVHPEIELVPAGGQNPIKGAARFRAWMEPDAFESQVVEPLDVRVVGNKVLLWTRAHIKGAGSGIESDFLGCVVWTYDEAGLNTRIEIYLPHQEAEALEAVGLTEFGVHPDPSS